MLDARDKALTELRAKVADVERNNRYHRKQWLAAVRGLRELRAALADYIRISEMKREGWGTDEIRRLNEIREMATMAIPPYADRHGEIEAYVAEGASDAGAGAIGVKDGKDCT